jgi:GTP-binding protein Era
MTTEKPAGFRCGYVTIIGEPNVGKSTLMNALLEQKISIVTHKPQTTRHKILGILSADNFQIVFLDTPGIIKPRYALQEVMMQFASSAIQDADLLLFMIDATSPGTDADLEHGEAFSRLKGLQKPVYLVINKIDLVRKESLLPVIEFYARACAFEGLIPISALKSDGTTELVTTLAKGLPEHPPLYPLDIVSEQNERFFVGEIIREKIFLRCQEEIPYSSTVDVVEFKERESGKWFISAEVYVERDSQKGIVIGKGGVMLKEIGGLARRDIEKFLGHPVFLELHVKVREKWRENEEWLRRFGYVSRT